jgi:carboxymethylenebutenolidase
MPSSLDLAVRSLGSTVAGSVSAGRTPRGWVGGERDDVSSVAMVSTRTEVVSARDGGAFDAYTVIPERGSGPGILLLQEIFGVSEYVRDAASRVAELGYVVLVPDLYWRMEPNVVIPPDEEGLAKAVTLSQRFDLEAGLQDCDTALEHLRGLPEVGGPAGVVGFCFGGTLAFHVAARSGPDTAVCYYGSGIPGALDEADDITCPILFHFGGSDPYIAREAIEQVWQRFAGRDDAELHIQDDAGHAFDNPAPLFHHAEAAAEAWEITAAFLHRTLPA